MSCNCIWREHTQLVGTTRCRTTAYHPCANGLFESFYRQLKTSLKTEPNPHKWTDVLPLVMLGIQTALKNDLKCTTAEVVYGTTLWLPGEFFESFPSITRSDQLCNAIKGHHVKPSSETTSKAPSSSGLCPGDLSSGTHAFIHHDAVRKSLQKPYGGLYWIIKHSRKHYTLELNGWKLFFSIVLNQLVDENLVIFPSIPNTNQSFDQVTPQNRESIPEFW